MKIDRPAEATVPLARKPNLEAVMTQTFRFLLHIILTGLFVPLAWMVLFAALSDQGLRGLPGDSFLRDACGFCLLYGIPYSLVTYWYLKRNWLDVGGGKAIRLLKLCVLCTIITPLTMAPLLVFIALGWKTVVVLPFSIGLGCVLFPAMRSVWRVNSQIA
jgi:hypothetical protein